MSEEKEPKELDLKLNYLWNGIVTRHMTNIVIQHTQEEFLLSLFEAKSPIILSPDDGKKVKELGFIDAECIARVVITPKRMEEFLKILNKNFEHFKQSKEGEN